MICESSYLSYSVILCQVDSQGNKLRSGCEIRHMHQQIQDHGDSICVDEHGLVAIVLGDVVQQAQCSLLEAWISHKLHSLHHSLEAVGRSPVTGYFPDPTASAAIKS